MNVFDDIKKSIEISDVQAINFFHKYLKNESFCFRNYNAYAKMQRLVEVIALNKIPFSSDWSRYDWYCRKPYLYHIDNNIITLHEDVITYENCTQVEFNQKELSINIFGQEYSCSRCEYDKYLKCVFKIKIEDMNYALKSYLVDEFFINELKNITRQYYAQIAYEKMIEMCVSFVKKDIEKLV